MSDQAVYRALHARLATLSFSPSPDFAWLPSGYKPSADKAWIRPTFLPEAKIALTTNPIQTKAPYFFQVDCFVPERDGPDEAYRLADAVSEHFFPNTGETFSLTAGAYTLQINNKPDTDPLDARGGFVGVAALIRCFALIN